MSELWFPSREWGNVVGKVMEVEKEHPGKSRELGRSVKIMVPVMASKVAGSYDVSTQEIKDHNRASICGRFPGAWEAYEKERGAAPAEPAEVVSTGTSLDKLTFIPREKMAWLKIQGFSNAEQIANLSDADIQKLGPGARGWRKKAGQFLEKA